MESAVLLEAVPETYRDPEGHWFGLSLRARPIMYVADKVDPSTLSTYEDLASPTWKGRICVRSSDNIYNQSLVASMIAADGEEATETWAKGLVANMARPPIGGDRDQISAAAAGECDIAIANTYYLAGMLTSGDPAQIQAAEAVRVFWPNQDGRGTHVNVSGVAMTHSAKNQANAIALAEFLVSPESQAWYAEVNGEYPVLPDAAISSLLTSWGTFKADALPLEQLGVRGPEAVLLMDRAGWK
jgi:iron(III) transport system substrate-binding protein